MRAVLMAGGKGSRLTPYTTILPKPLMPVGERPILDVIVRQLIRDSVEAVHISVGHLGSLIEAWVEQEGGYDVPVSFLYEDKPLGTAGALRNVPNLDGTFLAMNGDILTTLSFTEFADVHRASGAAATVAINERQIQVEYGVVHTDSEGRIERLEEKPSINFTVSMGVYAFEPSVVELIEPGEHIDFPDLLLRAHSADLKVGTHTFDGYWRDIGNHDDFEAAVSDFADDPERFLASASARGSDLKRSSPA